MTALTQIVTNEQELKTLKCRHGCDDPVGVYHILEGCICFTDPVQALCAQHFEKLCSTGDVNWLLKRSVPNNSTTPNSLISEDMLHRATDAIIASENTPVKMLRFRAEGYAQAVIAAMEKVQTSRDRAAPPESGDINATENGRSTGCGESDRAAARPEYDPPTLQAMHEAMGPRGEKNVTEFTDCIIKAWKQNEKTVPIFSAYLVAQAYLRTGPVSLEKCTMAVRRLIDECLKCHDYYPAPIEFVETVLDAAGVKYV